MLLFSEWEVSEADVFHVQVIGMNDGSCRAEACGVFPLMH